MSAHTSIVENQRRSYQSQAMDAARVLADKFAYLSEPQRAAILATVAAASATPVDITLQGEIGDEVECYMVLDGVLGRGPGPYAWKLGSGCLFEVIPQEGGHHE